MHKFRTFCAPLLMYLRPQLTWRLETGTKMTGRCMFIQVLMIFLSSEPYMFFELFHKNNSHIHRENAVFLLFRWWICNSLLWNNSKIKGRKNLEVKIGNTYINIAFRLF